MAKNGETTKGTFGIGIDDKSTPVIGVEKIKYYRNGDKIKKKTFRAKGPKGYGVKKVKEKVKYHKSGLVKKSNKDLPFREGVPLAETPRPFLE